MTLRVIKIRAQDPLAIGRAEFPQRHRASLRKRATETLDELKPFRGIDRYRRRNTLEFLMERKRSLGRQAVICVPGRQNMAGLRVSCHSRICDFPLIHVDSSIVEYFLLG